MKKTKQPRTYLVELFAKKGITKRLDLEVEKILGFHSKDGSTGRKILNGSRGLNSKNGTDKYILFAEAFSIDVEQIHAYEKALNLA